jgi:hypothetical protein
MTETTFGGMAAANRAVLVTGGGLALFEHLSDRALLEQQLAAEAVTPQEARGTP